MSFGGHKWFPMVAPRRSRVRLAFIAGSVVLAATLGVSDLFDHDLGAASAATASSNNIMITTIVPLVCTASTGAAAGGLTQPGVVNPALASGNVSVSIGTPVASRCSDGSVPAVTVEQSSGVISASGLVDGSTVSSSVDRDGTRILVSELALDSRASPLRLVTITY